MKKGLLIYNREDYEKNTFFAREIVERGREHDLDIRPVLREQLTMGVQDGKLVLTVDGQSVEDCDFGINRSRDEIASHQLEGMGMRVFNSARFTEIANHKVRTHQAVNALGIPSVDTVFVNRGAEFPAADYPVIKSVDGHGGEEVFLWEQGKSLPILENEYFIAQRIFRPSGMDVRVYVVGEEIVAAVKRTSVQDFRSNFSLGGSVEEYMLTPEQECVVRRIIAALKPDFAGIDFLTDGRDAFLFNEIEDAVGCRMLYSLGIMDIVQRFVSHISLELAAE